MENFCPSKCPGHFRCEIHKTLTFNLEDSDRHITVKVTASEKPSLDHKTSPVLWLGLSVNRCFEELILGKVVNQRGGFQKQGGSGFCPVSIGLIHLFVRTLLDLRTEMQNGFGKSSNLLEGCGHKPMSLKGVSACYREGQRGSRPSGAAGPGTGSPRDTVSPALYLPLWLLPHWPDRSLVSHPAAPMPGADWLSALFWFENCRDVLSSASTRKAPPRRGWQSCQKMETMWAEKRDVPFRPHEELGKVSLSFTPTVYQVLIDTEGEQALKWTGPQISSLHSPV